jgi:hypothetical protein
LLLPRLGYISLSFFIHAFLILPAHRSISAAEEEEEEEEEEAVAQRLKSPASKASNHKRECKPHGACKAIFDA